MKKKISINMILATFILLATVIFGIVFRMKMPNCGLADITHFSNIPKGKITLDYALGDDHFGSPEEMREKIDEAPVIALVAPTGKIRQTEASIGQEIVIKKIIRGGENISTEQKSYVYQPFGFGLIHDKIKFQNVLNVMNPDFEYLIFMDESPLNEYSKEPAFLLYSNYMGYLRIGGTETKTLKKKYKKYDFTELKDYEIFSVSEEVTNTFHTIKKDVLKEYLN